MADEVFALSPIAARAAQPSEADYEAIREAFMETSRGRWFLGEYAKRNRNADTGMVLDAVARIEEVLAAQKDALAAEKKAVRDDVLDTALAAIRSALAEARTAADAALGELSLQQNLAPVRKGARVIREIAWRLREIGADGRICDLIDSQVAAVEDAAARITAIDPASGLGGAFDMVERRIAAFNGGDAAASSEASPTEAAEETVEQILAPVGEPEAAAPAPPAQAFDAAAPEASSAAAPEASSIEALAVTADEPPVASAGVEAETTTADPAPAESIAESVVAAESASEPLDTFDADDEAMLDRIALEMAAPDSDDAYDPTFGKMPPDDDPEAGAYVIDVAFETAPARPPAPAKSAEVSRPVAKVLPPIAEVLPPIAVASPAPVPVQPQPAPAAVQPEPAPSLGSSLLANGIVPRPRPSKPDPFAPIRRMSQTERIAFFS